MRTSLLFFLLTAFSAQAQHALSQREPSRVEGMAGVQRLGDGAIANEGDAWNGPGAVTFGPGAFVEWDLGSDTRLTGLAIQADNNDTYIIAVSDDGASWRELWRAGGINAPGLRTRESPKLNDHGRFIRLMAEGGDGRFSVTEFELYSPQAHASELTRPKWIPRRPLELDAITLLVAAAAILLLASTRSPKLLLAALAAAGLYGAYQFAFVTTPATPDAHAAMPWLRLCVAALAALAVIRDQLWRGRWPAHPAFITGTLGVSAALALWCFLNLGTPQFHDAGARRGTWLHHYDMRTYFPIAKYFPELRFDGVYAASVLAVAEGRDLKDFDGVVLRDLRTHDITNVRDSRAHLAEVRARFSPERWAEFLKDMQYFRDAMSDSGFLRSMNDHGGNATPVWFLEARALFGGVPASDATLWRGVIADIALFALAFFCIAWAFGLRTALLSVTVFGAMDFYQFGSNWFGAGLRHDWLSFWAIGLALLKKRKFELAGIALAWSAYIRAFPALTFFTLSFPVLWTAGRQWFAGQRDEAKRTMKPMFRVVLGVVIASVVLVGLSVAVFGADSWSEWLRKVRILDRDNHLNNIAFRTYIVDGKPAWAAACVASISLLFFVLRRSSIWRAAIWGVALLPIVFNPANYYLHSMFLMVMLGARESLRGVLVWLTLLAMCMASYFSNITTDTGMHFKIETVIAFVTLGVLVLLEPRKRLSAV